MSEPVFSIIAPIFNELENLPLLYNRVSEVMDQTGEDWELILVDDGSSDGSTDIMRELAARDHRVRPIIFARNFGHQIAVTAGMDYSRGQAVVIIDADLQDPPEVILELIKVARRLPGGLRRAYRARRRKLVQVDHSLALLQAHLQNHRCENAPQHRRLPPDRPPGA